MPDFPLKGRIAVITGASAGIGLAAAEHLIHLGAAVVLNARRAEKLKSIAARLGPEDAAVVAGDCADPRVVSEMLDAAKHTFGGGTREADLILVNAGRGLAGSVLSSDPAQWEDMIRTNQLGAALLIREASARLLKELGSRTGPAALDRPRDIVVLGSTVGRHISPFSSMYGSTKFAVNALAEAARRELGPRGIRVSLLEPGFVESEFQGVAGYDPKWFEDIKAKIGPPLTPMDIARMIAFIVTQPPAVHVSDMLIRPTRQEYP
jgi:NADP-dependent 3-hydroxy acid dehydrogenase YdfG